MVEDFTVSKLIKIAILDNPLSNPSSKPASKKTVSCMHVYGGLNSFATTSSNMIYDPSEILAWTATYFNKVPMAASTD
jgi:hypothetical protein